MTHDVFISYSSKDRLAADAACAVLEAKGISCWIAPRDIVPGENWSASILGAIAAARVFLLIFSNNANASEQVGREVDIAANRRLTIIPFRIENTLPEKSLEYFLNTRHWLDAFTPPLEQHLSKLADAISLILGNDVPLAAAEPLPARRWAFGPSERRSLGPWLVAAAALLALAVIGRGWFTFHRDPPAPILSTAPYSALEMSGAAPRKATVIYPRMQCASTANGSGFDVKYCVTSTLEGQHDAGGQLNAYGPQNLFDGNPATAWCEGVQGPGDGQEIVVEFAQALIVSQISVVNGYAKSGATFAKNNSIHTLAAIWPDGSTSSLDLADSMSPQTIGIRHNQAVQRLALRIESVNGGSKWPDSCISELQFAVRAP